MGAMRNFGCFPPGQCHHPHDKQNLLNLPASVPENLSGYPLAGCCYTYDTQSEWVDSTPNLEGDIKELKDGQLTVVEAITEKSDNGGDIVVSPGSGDDSE